MTISRREIARNLMNCLNDPAQAEKVQAWSERDEPDMPGLSSTSAALLFAAAMGDNSSWQALTKRHPELAGLDMSDMPTVLDRLFNRIDRLFTGNQP